MEQKQTHVAVHLQENIITEQLHFDNEEINMREGDEVIKN